MDSFTSAREGVRSIDEREATSSDTQHPFSPKTYQSGRKKFFRYWEIDVLRLFFTLSLRVLLLLLCAPPGFIYSLLDPSSPMPK